MCKDTQILGEEEHLVQNQLQESKPENPFEKMAFGVEEKLVKIKTKGGILVLNQCGHCQFRFEIGLSTSAEPAEILSLFFFENLESDGDRLDNLWMIWNLTLDFILKCL